MKYFGQYTLEQQELTPRKASLDLNRKGFGN